MSSEVPTNWWNARVEGSLFDGMYYEGDRSHEGHAPELELTQKQRTARECRAVMQALAPTRGVRFLDCPCGEGRHALHLARHASIKVTGVDLNDVATEAATRRAGKAKIGNARFLRGDMRDLPLLDGEYDYALSMFLSFGFFDDEGDNIQTLKEYHRVLKSGGKLLIHTDVNPDRIEGDLFLDRKRRVLQNGALLCVSERFDSKSSRLIGSWSIDGPDGKRVAPYSVRVYSDMEMKELLAEAGFENAETVPFAYDSRSTVPPREIAYVAQKP